MKILKLLCKKILSLIYIFRCVKLRIRYKKGVRIRSHVRVDRGTKVVVSKNVWISNNVSFWGGGKIVLGENTHIGSFSSIYASKEGGVEFGMNVNCARNMFVIDANHGYKNKNVPINKQPMEIEKINIGNDCWIGANCTFLKGSSLGNGIVVGACSLVNHKFDDYSVIAGNPAKIISKR